MQVLIKNMVPHVALCACEVLVVNRSDAVDDPDEEVEVDCEGDSGDEDSDVDENA